MAYIRLPLGIKVALEYVYFGKVVVNVYHVTTDDPIITVKLLDICELFETWFDNSLSDLLSEDISLTSITATNLDEQYGEKVTYPVSPVIPGLIVSPGLPNQVAVVASLRTDQTGRSFRGRSYIPGISESNVSGNNVGSAWAASLVACFTTLRASLITDGDVLVVGSFQNAGAVRELGVATPVTSVIVNTRVDTQRRRLPMA